MRRHGRAQGARRSEVLRFIRDCRVRALEKARAAQSPATAPNHEYGVVGSLKADVLLTNPEAPCLGEILRMALE